jgi:predicted aspartyl protease
MFHLWRFIVLIMRGALLITVAAFMLHSSLDCAAQSAATLLSSSSQIVPADSANVTSGKLNRMIAEHNWLALQQALQSSTDAGTAFYRGVLLNHLAQYDKSRTLLEPLLANITASSDRTREKQVRLALADDEFSLFHYKQTADQYAALEKCCATLLDDRDRAATALPEKLAPLLAGAAAQTLELSDGFTIPLARSAAGSRAVRVAVDGHPSQWLFDPAAQITWLSLSQAKRVGLKLLGSDISLRRPDGKPTRVQAAIIPQLKFGGAFFRNVPAAIFIDDDAYPCDGVLALPLLQALGAVTASDDDHLTVTRSAPAQDGAQLFIDGEHLLAGVRANGEEYLYAVDPAGLAPAADSGVDLTLNFGGTPVVFHELVAADRRLSEDALDQLASYTLDFSAMRLQVRTH